MLTVAAVCAVVIVVVVVIAAVSSRGSTRRPGFKFGGVSATPPVGSGGPQPNHPPPAVAPGPAAAGGPTATFQPAPAAIALANRLSLADQVAQLFMVSVDGTTSTAVTADGGQDWGGFVLTSANFVSDGQVGTLAAALTAAARSGGGQAPLIAATQEGGPETAFRDLPPESEARIGASGPVAVAAAASAAQARLAARHLKASGINMTLAPLADVDTLQGVLSGRLFGSDPDLVARLSVAAVGAYRAAGMISAVGHFPGSGAASADPDQMTATVGLTLAQLRSRDLIPFAAVTPRAPVIVMSNAAYVAFDGVTPASLLPEAVQLLRRDYGFGGVVMTDDLDATLDPTASSPGTVAVQALQAGDDLLYISGPPSEHLSAYRTVLAAAHRSATVRGLVREALLRDLTLKIGYRILPRRAP